MALSSFPNYCIKRKYIGAMKIFRYNVDDKLTKEREPLKQRRKCLYRKACFLLAGLAAVAAFVSACGYVRTAPADSPEAKRPVISLMIPLHQPQPPKEEMIRAIESKAGASLDIDWVPNDNYTEKLVNAIETDTLKQVTSVSDTDYLLAKNAIRSGMFWEIGPYLDEYPNLSKLKQSTLQQTAVDGKIYGLFSERPPSRQGLIIRKDWLDKLGMKEPESLDDLYRMLARFTHDDPDGNGKNDTIGLADRNDLIFGAFKTFSSYFGTPNNWLLDNGKLQPAFMTGEYVDTMNFMKKLYDEGLVNRDFPVTSKQIQRYMFITGKAGAIVGAMDDAKRLRDEMKKIDPRAELTLVNRIRGPKGYGIWSIPDYSGVFLFSRRAIETESELRTILQLFDRMMEADICNLLRYGIEGLHYTVQSGKVVINQAMNESINKDVLPLYSLAIANISNPNLLKLSDTDQDPLAAQADKLIADNERILIRDPAAGLSSPTSDERGAALATIMTNATYDYILGRIDAAGFQKQIAAWKQSGGDAVMEELTAAYHSRLVIR
jgi:putative aldouronate transport system substrate-binding protein